MSTEAPSIATARVRLGRQTALHARPSVKLTKTARLYHAKIELAVSDLGPWIDAKSILKVMAAKAPSESLLFFRAQGSDAGTAINALVRLVEANFEEEIE